MQFITTVVGGVDRTFRRLSVENVIRIGTTAHAVSRRAILESLDAAGIADIEARLALLRIHADRRNTLDSIVAHAFTVDGAAEIVRAGMGEYGDAWLEERRTPEWIEMALDLIGAKKVDAEGKAASGTVPAT